MTHNSSRIPGFYELPSVERKHIVAKFSELSDGEVTSLVENHGLSETLSEVFIENSIGSFSLPFGIATNFRINQRDVLVPMAVEESSVVAAASHGAKLTRLGDGFQTSSTEPIMTGQVQVFMPSGTNYDGILQERKEQLMDYANRGQDRLIKRGGGVKDITWRYIKEISALIVHLHVHTCDAMGANIVNTLCEKISGVLPDLFPGCQIGLRILTNLTTRRRASAECLIPWQAFGRDFSQSSRVVDGIVKAWEFAWYDVYRATTNNKGVMNGIDPVLIATGNDWRAIEAGAHAYCIKDGQYRPMAKWTKVGHDLHGKLELPMAVGTVGGVTKLHPTAQIALKILGTPNARELSEVVVATGLSQNLSALRALATEGIQRGHMSLHQKNLDLLVANRPTFH